MSGADRSDQIAAYVIARGEVRIEELVSAFDVSRMTIHRHVEALAGRGVLRKLHGAVTAQPSGVYESLFRYRETQQPAAKAALARAVLEEVVPGQAIILDDSTTVAALAPLLADRGPLTVVTNSLGLSRRLADMGPEMRLINPGGDYHPTYDAFIGPVCENALARLKVNLCICSASAVAGASALIQDAQVTRVKQAMMAAAQRRVLVVDSSKFGKVALHLLAGLETFDAVYCDAGLPQDVAAGLRAAGVKLTVAKVA